MQTRCPLTDKEKELIRFNTEMIKLLVVLFMATGGGSLALIAEGIEMAREAILAFAGMVFAVTSGVLGLMIYMNTQKLLK